jgi:hypothetical protein
LGKWCHLLYMFIWRFMFYVTTSTIKQGGRV